MDIRITKDKWTAMVFGHKNSTLSCDITTESGSQFSLKNCTSTDPDVKPPDVTNWAFERIADLSYTVGYGLTTYGNTTYPSSFLDGMKSNHTNSYVMLECNPFGTLSTCDFSPDLD